MAKTRAPDADSGDDDSDDDSCEEWERHEAFYDDPMNLTRNKERLYEEELEVVWEKGGPGLVWYTDAYYWDAQVTDTDERWADDWDVDMSIYYDPTSGDRDAKDLADMRRERAMEQGGESSSVFVKNPMKFPGPPRRGRGGKYGKEPRYTGDQTDKTKFADFERYTSGIGSKVSDTSTR